MTAQLLHRALQHGRLASRRCGPRLAAHTTASAPPATSATRCPHCFITFATPAELAHHAAHHCFPDDPGEVLRRFPVGTEALDTVSGQRVQVLGGASNHNKVHSSVLVRELARGLEADVPISRLERG